MDRKYQNHESKHQKACHFEINPVSIIKEEPFERRIPDELNRILGKKLKARCQMLKE